jgi:hypothetical protein
MIPRLNFKKVQAHLNKPYNLIQISYLFTQRHTKLNERKTNIGCGFYFRDIYPSRSPQTGSRRDQPNLFFLRIKANKLNISLTITSN